MSVTVVALLTAATGTAQAQLDDMTSLRGAQEAEGMGGAKLSETVYLRLGVVAEAGYDSNVFYNDQRPIDSPTLQVTPSIVLSNDRREGPTPPARFALGASLLYREYLADEPGVEARRAFNPSFNGLLGYAPSTAFALTVSDQFVRSEEAPYSPDAPVIERSSNTGILDTRITPGGGRLQLTLRYTNTLDLYDTAAAFADRMGHDVMFSTAWKWLPKTALFLEGAIGYIHYLDDTRAAAQGRVNSLPWRALAGIRGLLTPKLTVNLGLGYADSIYNNDVVDPSGLSNLLARASLSYDPLTHTKLTLAYEHLIQDSPFVGNFYDSDSAGLSISQQVSAFVLRAFYVYQFRRYQGPASGGRRDHLQRAGVQADYFLQRWFFAGVGYSAQINRSSQATVLPGLLPADYTKHVILGRIGINY